MTPRMPFLVPGQRAWAHAVTVLPEGLADGALLEVQGPVPGSWSTYVREVATDRVFELGRENIDNGWEFEVSPGRWVPENDARVLDHLERAHAEQLAEADRMKDLERRSLCLRAVGFFARVLGRNGRLVPVEQCDGER
jgi:hypothetical protein